MAKRKKPFDEIMEAISEVSMAAQYPEAFDEESIRATLVKADKALRSLMNVRNIINSISTLNHDLVDACVPYLDFPELEQTVERLKDL